MNTLAEVTAYFEGLQQRFPVPGDRRGVFLAAYLEITRGVGARIRAGGFRDNAWTERYLVAFARLYRTALEAFDSGAPNGCPKAWRIAFEAARNGETSVLQDLALGMNAHINGDLARALLTVGIDPDRETRLADHRAVNEVLQAYTDRVQNTVAGLYAPVLGALDAGVGQADELIAGFAVAKARDHAWAKAVLLTEAGELSRDLLGKALDAETAWLARAICAPTAYNPPLRRALREIDEQQVWRLLWSPA